jgi:hypothetical protein
MPPILSSDVVPKPKSACKLVATNEFLKYPKDGNVWPFKPGIFDSVTEVVVWALPVSMHIRASMSIYISFFMAAYLFVLFKGISMPASTLKPLVFTRGT